MYVWEVRCLWEGVFCGGGCLIEDLYCFFWLVVVWMGKIKNGISGGEVMVWDLFIVYFVYFMFDVGLS